MAHHTVAVTWREYAFSFGIYAGVRPPKLTLLAGESAFLTGHTSSFFIHGCFSIVMLVFGGII